MAMFVAAKFSNEEMPVIFDPGTYQDLRPQDFVVVPRNGSEDVAFVAALEYKSIQLLKLRRTAYPKVLRRATKDEVESWWERKGLERRAMVLAKEKARELRLDIKISHVRVDPLDKKAVFHFTSEQRVDFRQLVKDLNAMLKIRIELWQIGVRDEARLVDGFGVCGQQTCCSSWLKDFRPITIRMAKDQDINLPPSKLSGQCGRLLCCLSYEVDQYRRMAREAIPKGATVKWGDKTGVVIDRNLVAGSYVVSEVTGAHHTVKESEIEGREGFVPDQMKRFGKKFNREMEEENENPLSDGEAPEAAVVAEDPSPAPPPKKFRRKEEFKKSGRPAPKSEPRTTASAAGDSQEKQGAPSESTQERRGKRRRGRGGRPKGDAGASAAPSNTPKPQQPSGDKSGEGGAPQGRKKKRRRPPPKRPQ